MEKELSALTLMSHVLRVAFGSGSAAEPDGGAAGVPQAAEASPKTAPWIWWTCSTGNIGMLF